MVAPQLPPPLPADAAGARAAQTFARYHARGGAKRLLVSGCTGYVGAFSMVRVPSLAGQSSPSQRPHMEAFGSRLLYTLWRSHGATQHALRG